MHFKDDGRLLVKVGDFLLNYLKVSVKVIVKRNIVCKFVVLTNKKKNYERIYDLFPIWRHKAFTYAIVSHCV